MNCRAETRRRLRSAKAVLRDRDDVLDVTETERDTVDAPTLEIVVDTDGLSPAVAGVCARHGLTVRDVSPQGSVWTALLVA